MGVPPTGIKVPPPPIDLKDNGHGVAMGETGFSFGGFFPAAPHPVLVYCPSRGLCALQELVAALGGVVLYLISPLRGSRNGCWWFGGGFEGSSNMAGGSALPPVAPPEHQLLSQCAWVFPVGLDWDMKNPISANAGCVRGVVSVAKFQLGRGVLPPKTTQCPLPWCSPGPSLTGTVPFPDIPKAGTPRVGQGGDAGVGGMQMGGGGQKAAKVLRTTGYLHQNPLTEGACEGGAQVFFLGSCFWAPELPVGWTGFGGDHFPSPSSPASHPPPPDLG